MVADHHKRKLLQVSSFPYHFSCPDVLRKLDGELIRAGKDYTLQIYQASTHPDHATLQTYFEKHPDITCTQLHSLSLIACKTPIIICLGFGLPFLVCFVKNLPNPICKV